jgi:hypothetical protein
MSVPGAGILADMALTLALAVAPRSDRVEVRLQEKSSTLTREGDTP